MKILFVETTTITVDKGKNLQLPLSELALPLEAGKKGIVSVFHPAISPRPIQFSIWPRGHLVLVLRQDASLLVGQHHRGIAKEKAAPSIPCESKHLPLINFAGVGCLCKSMTFSGVTGPHCCGVFEWIDLSLNYLAVSKCLSVDTCICSQSCG